MKNFLIQLKNNLKSVYNDEEQVFAHYIDEVFQKYDDVWDISEGFSFYNYDKRVQINKNKQQRKRVASKDIHIATQFFTPKWLVKYVVDNSLGRFLTNVDKEYCDGKFDINFENQNIKIFDPAVGTGNMLLYAYDLLEKAYNQKGMDKKEIPYKILGSFYGLDIDKRATEIAKKLLLKKAGLTHFDFNIFSFSEINPSLLDLAKNKGFIKLYELLSQLNKTVELGSIIKTYDILNDDANNLYRYLINSDDKEIILSLKLLTQKYDVILINPPYLSSSDYNEELKKYIYHNYKEYKQDLFSVFIVRCFEMLNNNGLLGVVCPYNWMFIKSFQNLRKLIIQKKSIYNLLQLSTSGYSKAVVYLSAFVAGNRKTDIGYYIRLNDFKGSLQQEYALKAINNLVPYRFIVNQNMFLKTPYNSIIYWHNKKFIENFDNKKISEYLEIRQGMATGDNKKFLKRITEVNANDIAFNASSIEDFDSKNKKYALYNKGGKFRKWYGNIDYVLCFDKASRDILSKQGNRMPSRKYYFNECVTWTLVSSKGHFSARYSNNSVFDVGGSCGFIKHNSPVSIYVILGYLCSKVASVYLNALNPTLNMQVGDIKNLPFIIPTKKDIKDIERLVKENIDISRKDWYNIKVADAFNRLKRNEEKLNEIFINLYSLNNILDKTVSDNLITVRREHEKQ